MTTLYYTTELGSEQEQLDPVSSKGGYKSSSVVGSGTLNNLFPNLTVEEILSKKRHSVCLILQKVGGVSLGNIGAWIESQPGLYQYKIGGVVPFTDNNTHWVNPIPSSENLPPVPIQLATDISTAVDLGLFDVDSIVGIWVVREVVTDLSPFFAPKGTNNQAMSEEQIEYIKTISAENLQTEQFTLKIESNLVF